MAYCDFCPCEECKHGSKWLISHAQTEDGRWICKICYTYELCIEGSPKGNRQPCFDCDGNVIPDCPHRPKLVTDWVLWNQEFEG